LLLAESSLILRELGVERIDTRTALEAAGVTIMVRLHSLEDARFVLARVAFNRAATLEAPEAETGRRPRISRAIGVVGLVAGLLVLLSALALAPADDDPGLRCPGGRGSLMAPRGGCLGVAPPEHR
jgi:hypothetical protein